MSSEPQRPVRRRLAALVPLLVAAVQPVLAAAPPVVTPVVTPVAPSLAAPAAPAPAAPAPAAPATAAPAPISPAEFAELLRSGSLEQLDLACRRLIDAGDPTRLRQVHARLLTLHPAPQPLPVVLANADVLIACQAPRAALEVLDRYGPAPGAERLSWLLLQWRAASSALDHRRAALALERLAGGDPARLEGLALPLVRRADGSVVTRSALDLLALHLEARGLRRQAAALLLAGRQPGLTGAARVQEVVRLLADLPPAQREALLETALQQAAAAGAWAQAAELLDTQAALPSARARERRLQLSPQLDDAYGEWLLRRSDPASASRAMELERQLRSPRAPGGHAPPAEPPPAAALPASPSPSPSSPSPSPRP